MKQRKIFGFSQNVFILSLVSLLNDIGGQTIKYAIPLFLTNALGIKTSIIGIVEGIGEAAPTLFQPLSGIISDKLQKRKPLVFIGQLLRLLISLLYFTNSWWLVLFLRFLDRSGKGIQAAPRDALLSLSSDAKNQGKSFGLSRAFDNIGAVVGLLLAAAIISLTAKNSSLLSLEIFQKIVLLAFIPMFIALILLALFIQDIKIKRNSGSQSKLNFHTDRKFFILLFIIFIFTLGNSSDAFLILKAQYSGFSLMSIFILLALFSFTASLVNIPAGIVSDKIGRKKTIVLGWLIYSLIYLGFGITTNQSAVLALFLAYGIYFGLTEGVLKAFIADVVPPEKKGTAYGLYNLVSGGTLLFSSLIAGFLWQIFSPSAAFYFGAVMAIAATVFLYILVK
ncbi:MFS transporter [Candidatus Gottesmanbacteria bacterium]|nr:MFS transporter [Candidatus Gottesmanbacteria bacterium]